MPSPTWCSPGDTPIAPAIAAAVHLAWDGPAEGASNRFLDAFRQLMGAEAAEPFEMTALRIFQMQPEPPEGYDPPPPWAHLQICPRCRTLRATKHTRPQRGRLKLEVLRDPDWLQRQFEKGENTNTLADKLGCSVANGVYWADRHGIRTPKERGARELDAAVRSLHQEGRGPGGIARELETTTSAVRQVLKRQGLANRKSGQVYFTEEWWITRMREWGWTKTKCAREAGIRPHAATYYVNRFGLSDITKKNARKKKAKYPVLTDPLTLRELLRRHDDVYESVAEELGCAPSLVSRYARELLGREKKHHNELPHSHRSWWEDRLEEGKVAHELAEEAGVEEKTAKEKLRLFGLLDQAYANELAREKARRSA